MKKTYLTAVAVLTTGIAWPALAVEPEQPATQEEATTTAPPAQQTMPAPGDPQSGMPMLYGPPAGMPMMGRPMPWCPPMMQGLKGNTAPGTTDEQTPGQSAAFEQPGMMPMMYGRRGGKPMMQGRRSMMNPEMRQGMMARREQHMATMEQHLANIEALLKELVELQKK